MTGDDADPGPAHGSTGRQLLGAERLMRRYFDAHPGARIEKVLELHETAGLTDGWTDAASKIAQQKVAGTVHLLGLQPTIELAEKNGETPTALIAIETLITLLEAAYIHGMVLGAFAALDITDPDEDPA